jgi:hypothetical protein
MTLHPEWAALSPADARRAAALVFADGLALASFELGESNYPNNVATELDRLVAIRNRQNDKD